MARKRYVRCYECGMEFNRLSLLNAGAGYNKKSRRYICPLCYKKKYGKKSSPTTYKVCGIIAMSVATLVMLMGLLLTFAMPPLGIAFIIFGFLFFRLGRKYWKISKAE